MQPLPSLPPPPVPVWDSSLGRYVLGPFTTVVVPLNPRDWWYSASQVDTFVDCARKWAWKYINGVEAAVEKESLTLGKEVHAQLELWLRDGTALNMLRDSGHIAMAGLHLIPLPKTPGMLVEKDFQIELGGYKFRGLKDFQILDRWVDGRKIPLVGDHKTTKDFRWAKTEDDLRDNIQACLYAADVMFRANTNECDLHWVYYRTKGSKQAQRVHLRLTRETATPTLKRMVKACDEMSLIRAAGLSAEQVPPNVNSCEMYGGCEYRDQQPCQFTPEERLRAIMTQAKTTNDLYERLQNRQQGINSPPPEQQQMPPPQTLQTAPPAPPTPVWDAAANAYVLPPVPLAPPPQAPPPQAPLQYSEDGKFVFVQGAWMPAHPPAPPQQPPPMPPPPPFLALATGLVPNPQAQAGWSPPPPAAPPPAAPAPPAPPPPPVAVWDAQKGTYVLPETPAAPKKRGRPKKNPAAVSTAMAAAVAAGTVPPPVDDEDIFFDDGSEDVAPTASPPPGQARDPQNLRAQMATLLNQMSSTLRTVAAMIQELP